MFIIILRIFKYNFELNLQMSKPVYRSALLLVGWMLIWARSVFFIDKVTSILLTADFKLFVIAPCVWFLPVHTAFMVNHALWIMMYVTVATSNGSRQFVWRHERWNKIIGSSATSLWRKTGIKINCFNVFCFIKLPNNFWYCFWCLLSCVLSRYTFGC